MTRKQAALDAKARERCCGVSDEVLERIVRKQDIAAALLVVLMIAAVFAAFVVAETVLLPSALSVYLLVILVVGVAADGGLGRLARRRSLAARELRRRREDRPAEEQTFDMNGSKPKKRSDMAGRRIAADLVALAAPLVAYALVDAHMVLSCVVAALGCAAYSWQLGNRSREQSGHCGESAVRELEDRRRREAREKAVGGEGGLKGEDRRRSATQSAVAEEVVDIM